MFQLEDSRFYGGVLVFSTGLASVRIFVVVYFNRFRVTGVRFYFRRVVGGFGQYFMINVVVLRIVSSRRSSQLGRDRLGYIFIFGLFRNFFSVSGRCIEVGRVFGNYFQEGCIVWGSVFDIVEGFFSLFNFLWDTLRFCISVGFFGGTEELQYLVVFDGVFVMVRF